MKVALQREKTMKIRALLAMAGIAILSATPASFAQSANTVSEAISRNGFLLENGLLIPAFDPAKGRKLFGSKGCVVCHSINGIGGGDAPDISAAHMEKPMNAFEFAAKMWRGAPAMIAMQEDELGAQIELNGEELADIIAFAHDATEQSRFSEADIPPAILNILNEDSDQEGEGKHDEPAEN